jgi:hypothetical protein
MRRILLDESVPLGLKAILREHHVLAAPELGWAGITNGRLLDAAEEAGFEILVTADRNIRAQQHLTGRRIALVVLSTNHWVTIRDNAAPLVAACGGAGEASYVQVAFPRPSLRRRPPPGRRDPM